ncbi:MAG: hypothetical protein GY866_04960, partial [Proteobacteria bacterium]|nr:hypothetical protein [Pseudomonadota bacterium]
IEAASLGAKVLIVEKGIRPGGASVITGTIPSKSLRETVKYVESLSRSNLSGIDIQLERKITVQELMHRKNSVVTQRVEDIIENYRQKGVDYMFGRAEFISPHEVLGVHIFGQTAAELIHIGQAVVNLKGNVAYFLETVMNFPTLSSAYKVAARDGMSHLK